MRGGGWCYLSQVAAVVLVVARHGHALSIGQKYYRRKGLSVPEQVFGPRLTTMCNTSPCWLLAKHVSRKLTTETILYVLSQQNGFALVGGDNGRRGGGLRSLEAGEAGA
jgi:hypothetical protein